MSTLSNSFIISNQVISIQSEIFSIRPVSHLTPQTLSRIPIKTWGSKKHDDSVLSLLITNDVQLDELETLTVDMIENRIRDRYRTDSIDNN